MSSFEDEKAKLDDQANRGVLIAESYKDENGNIGTKYHTPDNPDSYTLVCDNYSDGSIHYDNFITNIKKDGTPTFVSYTKQNVATGKTDEIRVDFDYVNQTQKKTKNGDKLSAEVTPMKSASPVTTNPNAEKPSSMDGYNPNITKVADVEGDVVTGADRVTTGNGTGTKTTAAVDDAGTTGAAGVEAGAEKVTGAAKKVADDLGISGADGGATGTDSIKDGTTTAAVDDAGTTGAAGVEAGAEKVTGAAKTVADNLGISGADGGATGTDSIKDGTTTAAVDDAGTTGAAGVEAGAEKNAGAAKEAADNLGKTGADGVTTGADAVKEGATTAAVDAAADAAAAGVKAGAETAEYSPKGGIDGKHYTNREEAIQRYIELTHASREDAEKIVDDYVKRGSLILRDKEEVKINEWTSRADNYTEVKTLKDDYDHGDGSKDVGDVKDQDKALVDFEGPYKDQIAKFNNGDGVIHAGQGISHHHHQTMTDSLEYNGKKVTYLPGQAIELAGDPTKLSTVQPLTEMYQNNIDKNVLGTGFNPPKDGKWSKIEYAAALASSGKYSVQDVLGTASALGEDNWGFYEGPYFKGTMFEGTEDLIDETGKSAEKMQQELTNDVNELIEGWKDIHNMLEEMSGKAANAFEFYTVQCVQGKFEVALGNINDRLKPACLAISLLYTTSNMKNITGAEGVKLPSPPAGLAEIEGVSPDAPLLKKLKEGEKVLNNYLGTGEDNKDPNLKDITEELDVAQTRLNGWQIEQARLGSRPQTVAETDPGTGEPREGTNKNADAQKRWDNRKAEIEKYLKQWRDEVDRLTKIYKELEDKIKEIRTVLNAILEYSMSLFDFVKKYETFRGTYRSYVLPGADGNNSDIYNWIKSGDINEIVNNHDAIIHGFEDYDKMPVISNKSDYKPGDVVLYDDAHGYIYVVKGYDPITGQLIIVCYDRNGNQVGSDIIVWDQREITPVGSIRDIPDWDEYDDVPDTFPIPETTKPPVPGTTKPPVPGTTKPPVPSTTKPPVPETTKPPVPETTKPPVPETTLPPEPTPTIIIHTIPTPTPMPTPTGPDSPHTGLDAIYGTGETKQSATGLGALAGLAAGAAGLGLTGLIGDKKEDEEEDDDSSFQMTEEEPTEENKQEETSQEAETSSPQFF